MGKSAAEVILRCKIRECW